MDITLLIWSKDRPMQLHLLLETILDKVPFLFKDIQILYKVTSDESEQSYQILLNRFNSKLPIILNKEQDFQNSTCKLVADSICHNFCAATDDCIIHKSIPNNTIVDIKLSPSEVFSLRLGHNTILQNCFTGQLQYSLNKYRNLSNNLISWNPHDYYPLNNYGYPFALDMHIYNRKKLLDLISNFSFKNTNELESKLFYKSNYIDTICSFTHSIACNLPMNNLSGITQSYSKLSTEELIKMYLDNQIFNTSAVYQHNYTGCHEILNLNMKSYIEH